MGVSQSQIYEFDKFRIDGSKRLLTNEKGEIVPLTPKVFDLLLCLAQNRGKVIEKDKLMSAIWPDTIVEESNLSQNISILRRILGEKRGQHQFIVTIPGHGYKFVAEVREVVDSTTRSEPPAIASGFSSEPGPAASRVFYDDKDPKIHKPRFALLGRKWLISLAALMILGVGLSGFYFWITRSQPVSNAPNKTIAVLPFKPLVTENRDEALEMGMADTLIARLSGNKEIVVRPLGSVRRYGTPEQDLLEAGRALGVESIVDGNIQRWGDKIRVNVRLINVADGASLWSGTFDEKFTDIFDVQDAITIKIAEALRLHFGGAGNLQLGKRSTENLEAYRLYLQGRFYALKTTPPNIRKGIAFYQQAIDIDPLYALAYAGMADAYRTLPITSDVASTEAFPKSKTAALKALEIDKRLPEAHIVLGYVASWYEWDWKTAENEIATAVEISPNNSDARRAKSLLLTVLGKHDEAVAEMKLARELDPLSLPTNALEAQALFYSGRDAEAFERLNKTFEIDPNYWIARLIAARILIGQNRFDEALNELKTAKEFSGGNSETVSLMGYALAKTGRREEALAMLEELTSRSGGQYVPSYNIAMIHNGLGDSESTLSWLERAVEDRDVRLILLKVEPKWNNLRTEPRFIELMKQMNFE